MAGQMICTNCGHVGKPKRITKGSIIVELGLWICFLFPGLIYSIWRLSSRYNGCPKCEHPNMISVTSPVAQKLLNQLYPNTPNSGTATSS